MRRPPPARYLLALALVLLLDLAGCMPAGGKIVELPRLNLPRLQYLTGLSKLAHSGGSLRIAAVFDQPGVSGLQVLTNSDGQLQVAGLDGSGAHAIATDGRCGGTPSVSPDGLWVACLLVSAPPGVTGFAPFGVEIAPLGRGSHTARQIIPLSEPQDVYHPLVVAGPAWSPDGRYLAVGFYCALEVFAVSPDDTSLTPVGSATSSALRYGNGCIISGVAWSPDSTRLLLNTYSGLTYQLDDHIALAPILAAQGAIVPVPASEFVQLPEQALMPGPVWRPQDTSAVLGVLAPGNRFAERVLYFTGVSQPRTVLLTLPDPSPTILAAAWTPDGRQLVLTLGQIQCVDCGQSVLPDIYLFTPAIPGQA